MSRERNIVINQNETFAETVTVTNENDGSPFDLTGYTVIAQMRRDYDSVYFQDLHPIINADPTTGLLTLNLVYLETAALAAGRWVYDVIIRNASLGVSDRIVGGIVTVTPASTLS